MTNNFQLAKERLAAVDVARWYGVQISHDGKSCRCPFHPDNHPSMSFFGNSYYCHVCHAGGDAVDFIARKEGIGQFDALKLANERHNLRLDLSPGSPAATYERLRARTEAAAAQAAFDQWREDFGNALFEIHRLATLKADSWGDISDAHAMAIEKQAEVDDLIHELMEQPREKQMEVFRNRRGYEEWAWQILNRSPRKSLAN